MVRNWPKSDSESIREAGAARMAADERAIGQPAGAGRAAPMQRASSNRHRAVNIITGAPFQAILSAGMSSF